MEHNPVGWFEIYVDDMHRAVSFYEQVLGLSLQALNTPAEEDGGLAMMAFPMNGAVMGASGALVKADQVVAGGNSVLVYFSCKDCGIEAGRVAAAGGRLLREKMAIGQYGFCAIAEDTEGNTFGLHSQV